jgi:hypothetical protein
MNQKTRIPRELPSHYLISLHIVDQESVLSSSALDALKEFYADRDARQKQFENLKTVAEENAAKGVPLTMNAFAEDWNESQFWVCLSAVGREPSDVDQGISILTRRRRFWLRSC